MDLEKAVILRTFANLTTAGIAARELEAYGIQWALTADDCGGMLPPLSGVKLMVAPQDAADARRILEDRSEPIPPGSELGDMQPPPTDPTTPGLGGPWPNPGE